MRRYLVALALVTAAFGCAAVFDPTSCSGPHYEHPEDPAPGRANGPSLRSAIESIGIDGYEDVVGDQD